jgi:hypothetical protein
VAYLIAAKDKNGVTQYARTVGKTAVKWTTDRDKARRYKNAETALAVARRIDVPEMRP